MGRILEITQDGEPLLHFECGATLPALQRRQLDALDARLDQGIELGGESIPAPDQGERVRFVIGLLLRALGRDDPGTARGLCTWLSQRLPELSAIRIITRGDDLEVDLECDADQASDV
ncbi:MAG: hypothetical protein LC646_05670 [Xanthomonadaceae bacterium]|nr:hypothetical protein [Xanthomonadaceae bacterium]